MKKARSLVSLLGLTLLAVPLTAGAQVSTNPAGKWVVNTETDKKGRTTSITALVQAAEGNRYFGIRCQKKKTSVFVTFDAFVGSTPQVQYRMGEQAPKSGYWNSADDGKSAFYPRREIEFLELLLPHPSLTVQVTPKGTGPLIVQFEIGDMESALVPLREACNW